MKALLLTFIAIAHYSCSRGQLYAPLIPFRDGDSVLFKDTIFYWKTFTGTDTFELEDPYTDEVNKIFHIENNIVRCNQHPVEEADLRDSTGHFTAFKEPGIAAIYDNINKALLQSSTAVIRDLQMNFIITNIVINTRGQIIFYKVYTDKTIHSTHSFYLDPEQTGLNKIPELNAAIDSILSNQERINPNNITLKSYYFSSRRFNPFYFPD